ncbi:MAG: hypothetical protein AB9891_10295 [Anaerolineaceae bacterium]
MTAPGLIQPGRRVIGSSRIQILDKDGQIGWGLPVEWDAYGDGTINPANTVYTISTAIVINALLDWVEIDPDAPVDQINSAIARSLKPYIEDNKKNPERLLPYSLSPFDESFHTYNPAAYLAGQMQRFSLQITDPTLRKDLRVTSDNIISILVQSRQIDETGGWYWFYSTDEGFNSIAHAGYIADGIRNYIKYGGALTDQLDWPAVYKHFEHFFMEDGYSVSLMPHILELNASETARLYDLGFFMYLEGLCNPDSDRKDKLLLFSKGYITSDGLYSIVPGSDVVINEYNSYLLYGWSSILSKDVNHTCLGPTGKSPQAFSLEPTDLSQNIEVPFTFYNSKSHSINFSFNIQSLQGEFLVDHAQNHLLPPKTIPLKVLEADDNTLIVFTRELWSSKIQIWLFSLDGETWSEFLFPEEFQANLFRQAVFYNDQILFILYDPISANNTLFRLLNINNEFAFDSSYKQTFPIEAIYEQQPHILTTEHDGKMFFASGSSFLIYSSNASGEDTQFESWKLDGDNRALELVSNDLGVFSLHKNIEYKVGGDQYPYFIYDVIYREKNESIFDGKIPFNLRIEERTPLYSLVEEPKDLVELFLVDMKNAPSSGMMSAGINNLEGEVVWSQSYYLQGFIDLLSKTNDPVLDLALQTIKPQVKNRLDFEMALLDKLLSEGPGLSCKVFTTNRTPVLHVVQTGKTLLLLKRYRKIENPIELKNFDAFRNQVDGLENHIEVLAQADQDTNPLNIGRYYLKWPKGAAFWSDGSGVPYNHQNCWAAGVMYDEDITSLDVITRQATKDISKQVLDYEGFRSFVPKNSPLNENDPMHYLWYYWWGDAKNGWNAQQNISVNTPDWRGDGNNIARPVYRSFDAIAILIGGEQFGFVNSQLADYFKNAVENDGLEMFIIPYLSIYNKIPEMNVDIIKKYIRVDEQPDFRNSFWAYKALYKHMVSD